MAKIKTHKTQSISTGSNVADAHAADAVAYVAVTALKGPDVPAEIIEAVRGLRSAVVIAHVVPDADALGSMLALARALTPPSQNSRRSNKIGLGGELTVPTSAQAKACGSVLLESLSVSLPGGSLSKRLEFLLERSDVPIATPESFQAADGFIVLDTAKLPRCNVGPELKDLDWVGGRPLINIDHHATNTRFGSVNWVVKEASSACELVYWFLKAGQVSLEPWVASLLYAGIQTDTLGFSLPSVSAPSLAAAAELVSLGADVGDIGERLCRSQSPSEFGLLRVIYAHTKTIADGRIAYSSAGYDEIHEAGCNAADIDDQISIPRSLDGVVLAMLFTEGHRGKTRINFRGSGPVTVVELAARFKGGGHPQAAGAVVSAGLQETMNMVIPAAIEHLKKFSCD